MLSLETIKKDTIWVVKMQGYRLSGTYEEMRPYADREDCRDFDICAVQPVHLEGFYNQLHTYEEKNHCWLTIDEFYNKVYNPQRRTWTKEEIKEIIMRNDSQCCKALIQLYNRQTDDEQETRLTSYQNGAGFNGVDANILSSFAEFYLRAGFLTPRQMQVLRRKIGKYCGQLAKIANGEL